MTLLKYAAVVALMGTPLSAQELNLAEASQGYTYFHKSGATIEDHDGAIVDCTRTASTLTTFAADTGYAKGLIPDLLNSGPARGVMGAAVENCMVTNHWQVLRVTDARGTGLWALPATELKVALSSLVGQDAPEGELVREWHNDAANALNKRFEAKPDFVQLGSLSVRSLGDLEISNLPNSKLLSENKAAKSVKTKEFDAPPATGAWLIVGWKGLSLHNGTGLVFKRKGLFRYKSPSSSDGLPDRVQASVGTVFAKGDGNFRIFAIPSGTWRLDALYGPPVMSLCFGSPSFDAKDGDVIYTGMFDLSAGNISPDMSLMPAQEFLGKTQTAKLIKPAEYTNGSVGPCVGNSAYALEFAPKSDAP